MSLLSEEEKQEALSELENSRVKEIFDKLDDDKDGFVTMAAIEQALDGAGIETGGELAQKGLAHCNPNEKGLVSWPHFARAVVVLGVKIRVAWFLRMQFDRMDTDNSGTINMQNLIDLIHASEAKEWFTDEMATNLFKRMDKDNSGTVEFKEFLVGFFEVMKEKLAAAQQ